MGQHGQRLNTGTCFSVSSDDKLVLFIFPGIPTGGPAIVAFYDKRIYIKSYDWRNINSHILLYPALLMCRHCFLTYIFHDKGRGTMVRSSFCLFLFYFVFIYFIFLFNSDFSWLDSATRYLNSMLKSNVDTSIELDTIKCANWLIDWLIACLRSSKQYFSHIQDEKSL
jgi:hypothetical protein